ncbi:MAG: hypothetical protein FJX77_10380, partial [Armatimonadetes bacterium]|nr:hypothetical protein [Armatimonadota bacterium]
MYTELTTLGAALCQPGARIVGARPDLTAQAEQTVVALPAGGFGYRMRDLSAETGGVTQKALLPLPTGETLIERILRDYAEAGYRQFLALVNYEGQAVEAQVGDGSRWGVTLRYSYDPQPTGSGRTGAMVHALRDGLLPRGVRVAVHNADCQIYNYPGSFPRDFLAAHLQAVEQQGVQVTLAAVEGTPYPFTGMQIQDGRVTTVEMYPFIPVPTHTGITLLEPEAIATIEARAGVSQKNFESDLFPLWAQEGRLAALVTPHSHWVAVDDRKS